MLDANKFGTLTGARRVWAVAAVEGARMRLVALHRQLMRRLARRDRVVYLGNYLGRDADVLGTLDELIDFRREVLSLPGMMAEDIVFLRGAQEEMWQKLHQLQLAFDPADVLDWMLERGLAGTIEAYGGNVADGRKSARDRIVALTRWTDGLRDAVNGYPGHRDLMSHLKCACVTSDGALLFVHAGLDPTQPLETQRDSFWWNPGGFARLATPYGGFRRVIRGFDPERAGVSIGEFSATIDGGCGAGGVLVACCFDLDGRLVDRIEA